MRGSLEMSFTHFFGPKHWVVAGITRMLDQTLVMPPRSPVARLSPARRPSYVIPAQWKVSMTADYRCFSDPTRDEGKDVHWYFGGRGDAGKRE